MGNWQPLQIPRGAEGRAGPEAPRYRRMNELAPYMQDAHDRLTSEFERYARLKADDPDASWGAFMEFLDTLQRHMALEEEVLFPVFSARPAPGMMPQLAALKSDHRRIIALLDELQVCLAEFNPHAGPLERDLRALLDAHNQAEEQLFQPWLDGTLSAGERQSLRDRMARFGVYVPAAAAR